MGLLLDEAADLIAVHVRHYDVQQDQVRLTRELIEKVDELIDKGMYPNRSEAIRDAVRRLQLK